MHETREELKKYYEDERKHLEEIAEIKIEIIKEENEDKMKSLFE